MSSDGRYPSLPPLTAALLEHYLGELFPFAALCMAHIRSPLHGSTAAGFGAAAVGACVAGLEVPGVRFITGAFGTCCPTLAARSEAAPAARGS